MPLGDVKTFCIHLEMSSVLLIATLRLSVHLFSVLNQADLRYLPLLKVIQRSTQHVPNSV